MAEESLGCGGGGGGHKCFNYAFTISLFASQCQVPVVAPFLPSTRLSFIGITMETTPVKMSGSEGGEGGVEEELQVG